MTQDEQKQWKCSSCGVSFAFYSGARHFLAHCVYCVAKIRAHAEATPRFAEYANKDTPEACDASAWAVIIDDWLDHGRDLPEHVVAGDREAFERWLAGGPSTPAALRYGRSRAPRQP